MAPSRAPGLSESFWPRLKTQAQPLSPGPAPHGRRPTSKLLAFPTLQLVSRSLPRFLSRPRPTLSVPPPRSWPRARAPAPPPLWKLHPHILGPSSTLLALSLRSGSVSRSRPSSHFRSHLHVLGLVPTFPFYPKGQHRPTLSVPPHARSPAPRSGPSLGLGPAPRPGPAPALPGGAGGGARAWVSALWAWAPRSGK